VPIPLSCNTHDEMSQLMLIIENLILVVGINLCDIMTHKYVGITFMLL